ncbi:MAG: hypothetical protein RJA07_2548 [Bacteroidota bacterium]|jgi:gliding motility-associated-like protein
MKYYISFLLLCFFILPSKIFATHNRAGEIVYKHISNNTYEITIVVYNKNPFTSPTPVAYRYFLKDVKWGDGDSSTVFKTDSLTICDSIIRNQYTTRHTYPGPGKYTICWGERNRNGGICNINNSDQVAFYLQSELEFPDPQFLGYNNSVVFLNSPVTFAHVGVAYRYNSNAFDIDGDSLAYELTSPMLDCGVGISPLNYTFPQGLTLNAKTGEINWTPPACCMVNIAFWVKEYRKLLSGQIKYVGKTLRDMQILVSCNTNHQPTFQNINDICMYAGQTITQQITATDIDVTQLLNLTANGAPFTNIVSHPAIFTTSPPSTNVTGTFTWQTDCNDIRPQFYQVVFRVVDSIPFDGSCSSNSLNDNYTWRIFLLPPPPQNVVAVQVQQHIHVSWQSLYSCSSSPKFKYFSVWRKIGCEAETIDSCQQSLNGTNYQLIASKVSAYNYDDYNVVRGQTYSYKIVAEFNDLAPSGQPYNAFSSAPSLQACASLKLDVPVIINVSVLQTNAAVGEVFVRWSKPSLLDFDTLVHTPPYTFELYHGTKNNLINTKITTKTFTSFHQIQLASDTSFHHQNIDTKNDKHFYQIRFFANNKVDSIGSSDIASSIYLDAIGAEKKIVLKWSETVPWVNDSFIVFRYNKVSGLYDSISVVTNHTFTNWNLMNDSLYCYYIKSHGHFSAPNLNYETFNLSEISCNVPHDTTAPCITTLTVHNDCENSSTPNNDITIQNHLTWLNPNAICGADDVKKYYIYYSTTDSLPLIKIDSIAPATNTSFNHSYNNSVAGCYAITAIDSAGNESRFSNIVCMDNCPVYILPNTFTPNGDGKNDLFHPFLPYRFVDHIELKIYNKWGSQIFYTEDANVGWDGKSNGKDMDASQYYYVCYVYEIRVNGIVKNKKPLTGFIELIR